MENWSSDFATSIVLWGSFMVFWAVKSITPTLVYINYFPSIKYTILLQSRGTLWQKKSQILKGEKGLNTKILAMMIWK